jgi:hypothetical protein
MLGTIRNAYLRGMVNIIAQIASTPTPTTNKLINFSTSF